MGETKKCSGCGKLKKLSEFHRNRSRPDGHTCRCKACVLAYNRQPEQKMRKKLYNQSKAGKDARRRYKRSVKGQAALKRIACNRSYAKIKKTAKHKATVYRAVLAYNKRYPERNLARYKVKYAVRTGKLPRPDSFPCERCGEIAKHYHHADYTKPLMVTPLCRPCHVELHAEQKRTQP